MKKLLLLIYVTFLLTVSFTAAGYADTAVNENKKTASKTSPAKRSMQVPEPASLLLLGTGLLGVSLKLSQRRKSKS